MHHLDSQARRFNPLIGEINQKKQRQLDLVKQRAKVEKQLAWFERRSLEELTSEHDRRLADVDQLTNRLGELDQQRSSLDHQANTLRPLARLKGDPRTWFSKERRGAARKVMDLKAMCAALDKEHDAATKRVAAARANATKQRRIIERFTATDPDALRAQLAQLAEEESLLDLELTNLRARSEKVNDAIREPLTNLVDLLEEVEQLRLREAAASDGIASLERKIQRAKDIDYRLTHSSDPRARWQLHEECESEFGEGKPVSVLRRLRPQRDQAARERDSLTRQIERASRSIAKTEKRVRHVAKAASRQIGLIVIDGNNLCYDGERLIGLSALAPLVKELAVEHAVTVIFDPGIYKMTRMQANDLRAALPGATVHVVAPGTAADETILDTAADPVAFVLSNDRFTDFRDKLAVREDRVIRHEILHGRVFVHDLGVSLAFR